MASDESDVKQVVNYIHSVLSRSNAHISNKDIKEWVYNTLAPYYDSLPEEHQTVSKESVVGDEEDLTGYESMLKDTADKLNMTVDDVKAKVLAATPTLVKQRYGSEDAAICHFLPKFRELYGLDGDV